MAKDSRNKGETISVNDAIRKYAPKEVDVESLLDSLEELDEIDLIDAIGLLAAQGGEKNLGAILVLVKVHQSRPPVQISLSGKCIKIRADLPKKFFLLFVTAPGLVGLFFKIISEM